MPIWGGLQFLSPPFPHPCCLSIYQIISHNHHCAHLTNIWFIQLKKWFNTFVFVVCWAISTKSRQMLWNLVQLKHKELLNTRVFNVLELMHFNWNNINYQSITLIIFKQANKYYWHNSWSYLNTAMIVVDSNANIPLEQQSGNCVALIPSNLELWTQAIWNVTFWRSRGCHKCSCDFLQLFLQNSSSPSALTTRFDC